MAVIAEQQREAGERAQTPGTPTGIDTDGSRTIPRDIPGTRPGASGQRPPGHPPVTRPAAPTSRPGVRRGTAMDALSIFGGLAGG